MDVDRGEAGGGQPEMEDEFACAGMLRGSLTSLHDTVERIFGVTFVIGDDHLPDVNNGQIWLKLRGPPKNVKAAKLFVKGVVNQEEQREVSYPIVLHCVFCGAKGLFMDCLIESTSAHIMVGSPGFLLISGLAEPVVRAYSLITDLLERYENTQSGHSEAYDRRSGESLDSRRTFKTIVEKREDRHILDLLVLPGSVKEVLLDLVKESGRGSSLDLADGHGGPRLDEDTEDRLERAAASMRTVPEQGGSSDSGAAAENFFCLPGPRGREEGAEERRVQTPQEMGEEDQVAAVGAEGMEDEDKQELSVGNKEFYLLLKFFTAMGYTEDVVKRVLARTGLKEASQILDLVQQEQDCSDREQRGIGSGGQDQIELSGVPLNRSERNRPCETEDRHGEWSNGEMGGVNEAPGGGATGSTRLFDGEKKEDGHDGDFVMGVLKKAAVSCGYKEQKVDKVYSMLSDRSIHQLLLELQREGSREIDPFREGPREMGDLFLGKESHKAGPAEDEASKAQLHVPAAKRETPDVAAPVAEPDLFQWKPTARQYTTQPKQHQPPKPQAPHQTNPPKVKGPPTHSYPSPVDRPIIFQSNQQHGLLNPQTEDRIPNPKLPSSNSVQQGSSPTRAREGRGFTSSVVVTGEQRFMEGLQMPFDLRLTDKPVNSKLRTIVIDGSNVAMSHGLGHFFSCRGIALAVQHFWDRGHRHISALLPQWRQKSDSRIKEQHYLSELQKLGLLSFTPSREVQGKRISSYDDRLMLQLAQKTDGVIVTNDNLRDLLDESPVWRDIIKKRLLQYTFVGDLFMVPDDPLGRGGPHLDDFLRSEHRIPDPGNHSFAGVATVYPPSRTPLSQSEFTNFRDRTLGDAQDAAGGGGRGGGRGRGKGLSPQRRKHGAEASGLADRTPEETNSLKEQLCQVFTGQSNMVTLVLQCHPAETDINVLSDLLLEVQTG